MPPDQLTLREAVDKIALKAKTRRLDLSFNEILAMYSEGELEIQPAFQRIFVWNEVKQSQFIESLLLELPVPPIYVVEEKEGQFVLVDGLQRISTYLHFRGELINRWKEISRGQFLTLEGCDIAKELNGKEWRDLDTALQIRLKRSFVSVQVIRKESDPDLKFHMFKRLNDGGTPISPQQVRNCVIRMLDGGSEMMDFAEELTAQPDYTSCCSESLTLEQRDEQFDQELILRFFAMKNRPTLFKHDVGSFIDDFTEGVVRKTIEFDRDVEREIFVKTFQILNASTGELSFTFPNRTRTALTRGFSTYHFEGVTLGLQASISQLDPTNENQMSRLSEALKQARLSEEFRAVSSGGGLNSVGPFQKRVAIIQGAVSNIL